MNILHYALGFPPYRTGGMTKYCLDLMAAQKKTGHQVGMLWPGRIKRYNSGLQIRTAKSETIGLNLFCNSYEMMNPLPVPLLDGIQNVNAYMMAKDIENFQRFITEKKIHILHVHTLMGLPRACIDAAKELSISTVYTTHDYFGLCPKWGLVKNGTICTDDHECFDCVICNKTALSLNKIKLLQSPLYMKLKRFPVVSILRRQHNESLYEKSTGENRGSRENVYTDTTKKSAQQYRCLREYYIGMLQKFDVLHFNSTNTMHVFEKYSAFLNNGKVISVSHGSIADNRKFRTYGNVIRFGYLGPITEHKGFYLLRDICDQIYDQGINSFELHIFASYEGNAPYLIKHNPYLYPDLPDVMNCFDVLIVPSLWNETFGFTVLEALSYGVPTIVNESVGAKDLIEDGKNGMVVTPQTLKNTMVGMLRSPECIQRMNSYILKKFQVQVMRTHEKQIEEQCYRNC